MNGERGMVNANDRPRGQLRGENVSCLLYRENFAISRMKYLDINLFSIYDICYFDRGV